MTKGTLNKIFCKDKYPEDTSIMSGTKLQFKYMYLMHCSYTELAALLCGLYSLVSLCGQLALLALPVVSHLCDLLLQLTNQL